MSRGRRGDARFGGDSAISDSSYGIGMLTGNPFVDTGLGVVGVLAKLDNLDKLTPSHLKSVYGDGSRLADWNLRFKSFTQLFTVNNPLTHPGLKRSGISVAIYKNLMSAVLAEVDKLGCGSRCWACGNQSDFNLSKTYKQAVEDAGGIPPKEEKRVGRDLFPLAGSLGSDAQFLPSASDAPYLCPRCLFAVQYLPLGIVLIKSYSSRGEIKSFPAVFQSTSIEFWYELLREIVEAITRRAYAGEYETIGKKEGGQAATGILFNLFERIQRNQRRESVPKGTDLYIWRFNNFGDSPDCRIDAIPNAALEFLSKAVMSGLREELETLVASEGKKLRYSLFQCILDGRDYPSLYPEGKRKGASSKLFTLYETNIRKHSANSLRQAHKLAREVASSISEKELARIRLSSAFRQATVRNRFKATIIDMAKRGEFTLKNYLDLFSTEDGHEFSVGWEGWELIRFYLHHTTEDFLRSEEKEETPGKETPQLQYYAARIYNHYLYERGKDRFRKEILAQMSRRIGDSWLRNQFVQLAESAEGFTYNHWSGLCVSDRGKSLTSETLFQMRLLWTQWIHEKDVSIGAPTIPEKEPNDGLPDHVRTLVESLFNRYVERRGIERLHRDILLRLRRREIGLSWLKREIMEQVPQAMTPITEEEWEEFLIDEEGQNIQNDRLFQLHLALANLYREKHGN